MPPLKQLTKARLQAWVTQLEGGATASEIARRTGHPKEEIERLAREGKIRLAPDRAGPGAPADPRALMAGSDPPSSTDSTEGPGSLAPADYLEQQTLLADAESIGAEMRTPLSNEDADRLSSHDYFRLKRLIRQVEKTGPRWPLSRLRLVVSEMQRLLLSVKRYRSVLFSCDALVRERDVRSKQVASLAEAEKAGRAAVEQITRQQDSLQTTIREDLAEFERKKNEVRSTLWALEAEAQGRRGQLDTTAELLRSADLELQEKHRQIAQANQELETLAVKTREAQGRLEEVKGITPELRDAAYRALAGLRKARKKLREHETVLDQVNRKLWGELAVVSSPEAVRPALPSPSDTTAPATVRSPEADWESLRALPIPLPDEPPRPLGAEGAANGSGPPRGGPRGAVGLPVQLRARLAVVRPNGDAPPPTAAARAAPLASSNGVT